MIKINGNSKIQNKFNIHSAITIAWEAAGDWDAKWEATATWQAWFTTLLVTTLISILKAINWACPNCYYPELIEWGTYTTGGGAFG